MKQLKKITKWKAVSFMMGVMTLLSILFVTNMSPFAASRTTVYGNTILEVGSTGSEVIQLQKDLTSLGFSTKGTDGSFGTNTYNAVIAFQKSSGLTADGKVGPYTKSKISQALANATVLKKGSQGSSVTTLQNNLTVLGYDTKGTDGNFGQNTYNAVIAFQKAYGLTADGIAGPKTINKISQALIDGSSVLKLGSTGDNVVLLQKELTSLGYSTKGIDGTFGQNTYNAVVAFQKAKGLKADGFVGPATRGQLDEALASKSSVLKMGSSGPAVETLQEDLSKLGYDPHGADGEFGTNTYNAVIALQKANGLTMDGIVGLSTRARIDDLLYIAKTNTSIVLKTGSKGSAVTTLQKNLTSLGYNTYGTDGIFGTNTYNAVIKFQRDNGLVADGKVGMQTQNAIQIAIASGSKKPSVPSGSFNITSSGVDFISKYEGFSSTPYRGEDYQNLTIGYGHVIRPGEDLTYLTKQQALDLLADDLQSRVAKVNKLTAGISIQQQNFDSLVSFGYNLGLGALEKSTLLKDVKVRASSTIIKNDFLMWVKCNGETLRGLVNRRTDEFEMYAYGDYVRNH